MTRVFLMQIGVIGKRRLMHGVKYSLIFIKNFLRTVCRLMSSSGLRNVQSVQMHRGTSLLGGPHLIFRAQKKIDCEKL